MSIATMRPLPHHQPLLRRSVPGPAGPNRLRGWRWRGWGELAACALLVLASTVALTGRAAAQSAPASSATTYTAQPLASIRAAAIAALGADTNEADATVDPGLRMAACGQPLQAVATGPKTVQVRCDDTPGWRLYVPVRVRREADVVVLTAPAPSGVAIAASQLAVQRRDIGQATGPVFTDPAALAGRAPRRALAAGQVPTEADLAVGSPLRRGDPVVLVARTGGIEVRMPGRALGPARAGGTVTVQNAASNRVLRGRLVAEGVIEVLQ